MNRRRFLPTFVTWLTLLPYSSSAFLSPSICAKIVGKSFSLRQRNNTISYQRLTSCGSLASRTRTPLRVFGFARRMVFFTSAMTWSTLQRVQGYLSSFSLLLSACNMSDFASQVWPLSLFGVLRACINLSNCPLNTAPKVKNPPAFSKINHRYMRQRMSARLQCISKSRCCAAEPLVDYYTSGSNLDLYTAQQLCSSSQSAREFPMEFLQIGTPAIYTVAHMLRWTCHQRYAAKKQCLVNETSQSAFLIEVNCRRACLRSLSARKLWRAAPRFVSYIMQLSGTSYFVCNRIAKKAFCLASTQSGLECIRFTQSNMDSWI